MRDEDKTKRQLIDELGELRRRVAALGTAAAGGSSPVRPAAATKAERERDRLQAILTAAIDCLPFEFFAIGTDGRYIYENAVERKLFGGGVGKRPEEYAPDEATRRLWLENNRRAMAGERVEGEFERDIGGEPRHYYNVIMPIQQGGQLYGILGVNIDVTRRKRAEAALQKANDELERRVVERTAELTAANGKLQREVEERRRAEEALRQSEEEHRGLLEACPDAVVMTDLDMRIVFTSRQTWKLLGVPEDAELVGRSVLENVIDQQRPRLAANHAKVLAAGVRRNTEYTVRRRDGTLVPTETCSAVICDAAGRPKGTMAVIRDISERRNAEAALRASEERFRVAFEEAPVGMVMAVKEAVIARVNRSFCRMSGYTQEELLGKSIRDLTYAEDREQSDDLSRQLMAGEIPSFSLQKRFLKASGQFFWAQTTVVAVRGPDAAVAFALGIVEDITGRKRADEALRNEHRMLQYMLHASDHERQLIAYDIHDGLAQQLAGAIMQFQVYDHLKEADPAEAQKAYHGGATLLRQAHLEARRLISGVRPPALDESGVVAAVAHLIEDRGLPAGPKVEFHSKVRFRRLAAVLENVIYRIIQEGLGNALRHSQSKEVRVSLLQRGGKVRIEIRDWGVGFDPGAARGDRFGLAGIRQRARLLGGKCRIQSRPGQGTRVLVELPVLEREAA